MARKLVEVLSGLGDIYAGGEPLRRTHYLLEIFSDTESHPGSTVVIEGSVDIAGMGEAVVLAGPQVLTLQIEDGRRVSFTLSSTAGRIHVIGGLEPASAS